MRHTYYYFLTAFVYDKQVVPVPDKVNKIGITGELRSLTNENMHEREKQNNARKTELLMHERALSTVA